MKAQRPGGEKPQTRKTGPEPLDPIAMHPIGVVRSPFADKAAAPRQAVASQGARGTVELLPDMRFEDALEGIEAWSHLWIVFAFHLNEGWKPKVQPPRSETKRGVFSTRSPHRPNPIGMSVVKLERVEGLTLHVSEIDMVDGTPVLDVKPYVPYADAIATASSGWLEVERRPSDPTPRYEVVYAPGARTELDFLRVGYDIDLATPIETALALGPEPHAYRRIRPQPDGSSILAMKAWRARFVSEEKRIEVLSIRSGHADRDLASSDPTLDAHRAFVARFGRDR